jgi:hypothetical protein
MCVGSFLPFQTTYYLNGHHIIAGELQRRGVRFRTDDNAFLWTANPFETGPAVLEELGFTTPRTDLRVRDERAPARSSSRALPSR